MTNQYNDIGNSDCVLIIGSNAAENHPISFKWVTRAMEKGAKLIVVDPRFTRSASLADVYAPMRSGTDIAFIGGIINYCLQNKLYHDEYVREYTTSSFLIKPEFSFKDGMFSGYNPAKRAYDKATWGYQTDAQGNPLRDKTLKDPNCVFQLMKKHYSRYTPEMVERICGTPKEKFLEVAKTYSATGKPGKSGTIMYAMGTTQHTYGSQNVASYAMLQLLLGNTGVAGGGVNALRGESNVQGSTDMALLFHIIPAYMSTPDKAAHPTFKDYIEKETPKAGYWKNKPKFFVSLLKAWWGDNAKKENDFCYSYMPKKSANYSWIKLFEAMYGGTIKGLLCWGQNPAVSGPHSTLERKALEKLDWMVMVDLWEHETADFWKRPGVNPADIKTEVFLLPASASFEKEGSISNSGRILQWRWKGAEPPGEAKDDLWMINRLMLEVRSLYAKDRKAVYPAPILQLTWDYGKDEPDINKVVKEINGYTVADGKPVVNFTKLADDGSTACGNWIYSGILPEEGKNLMKRRIAEKEGIGLNPEWAFAWPVNRRIIYNRASADPTGKPYNKDKWLVKWEDGKWVTRDVPDFGWKDATTGAMIPPEKSAAAPFIMLPEGCGRLFAPGLADGPFPEHYEPYESPVKNALSKTQNDPCAVLTKTDLDKLAGVGSAEFPIIATTYRVTEHWQGGAMTRNLPWLCELMPNVFVEMSKSLAGAKGIKNGEKVTIRTARGKITAIACVTDRFKPFKLNGKMVEEVGLPWHYGYSGIATDDSANVLTPHIGDANTAIPEYKAFLCNIEKGIV